MGQITDNKLGGVINFHNTIVTASAAIGRKESFVRDCAIHRNGYHYKHISHTQRISRNKHIFHKKHTLFALKKVCLFWEEEDFGNYK